MILLAAMIVLGTCGFVAEGKAPAVGDWTMPCRIMADAPGSLCWCPAVLAAAAIA